MQELLFSSIVCCSWLQFLSFHQPLVLKCTLLFMSLNKWIIKPWAPKRIMSTLHSGIIHFLVMLNNMTIPLWFWPPTSGSQFKSALISILFSFKSIHDLLPCYLPDITHIKTPQRRLCPVNRSSITECSLLVRQTTMATMEPSASEPNL